MSNFIETQNLNFEYDSDTENVNLVLKDINLTIERGQFVAILGHNGSGKSTLAKHFNAVLVPQSGKVEVLGLDTKNEANHLKIRENVGMVFQNPDNQIVASLVEEDVAFAPENLGVDPVEIRERVDRCLDVVGMSEYKTKAPHMLSGGQKQRIAIAGVLAMQPECIVLDEPTAMLDPSGRQEVMKIIEELNRKHNTTIVLITHHMNEASRADRVIVVNDGHIVADGTPKDVFRNEEVIYNSGLSMPQTVKLMKALNENGFNLNTSALTIEECADEIYKELTKR